MKPKDSTLGPIGLRAVAFLQQEERSKLRTGDLVAPLGLSPKQERELLSRLSRAGLIVRVKRGLYLVPEKVPPGGKWMPGEWTLVLEYMKGVGATYYIGGPSAFQYYGLTTQVPQIVTVYNDKISGLRAMGKASAQFIRVAQNRIGGSVDLTLPTGENVRVSSLPRTILDALYDWSRFNSTPQVFQWIRDRKGERKFLGDLVAMALRYGNLSARRRLGYALEIMRAAPALIRKIRKGTRIGSGRISLIPSLPARGRVNSRWGLIINGQI